MIQERRRRASSVHGEVKDELCPPRIPGHPNPSTVDQDDDRTYAFAATAAILSAAGVSAEAFATAWWLALAVGLAGSLLTITTGAIDWLSISRGTPLWRTATTHALVMAAASAVFAVAVATGHSSYTGRSIDTAPLVLTIAGLAVLAVGGWLGGALTYVHGMRVSGLPDEPALKASSPIPHEEKSKPPSSKTHVDWRVPWRAPTLRSAEIPAKRPLLAEWSRVPKPRAQVRFLPGAFSFMVCARNIGAMRWARESVVRPLVVRAPQPLVPDVTRAPLQSLNSSVKERPASALTQEEGPQQGAGLLVCLNCQRFGCFRACTDFRFSRRPSRCSVSRRMARRCRHTGDSSRRCC